LFYRYDRAQQHHARRSCHHRLPHVRPDHRERLLRTEDLKLIGSNNDENGVTTNSRILTSIQAGTYLLLVNSARTATGVYELEYRLEPPRDCAVQELSAGATVMGTLVLGGCRVLDALTPSEDTASATVYRLTLAERLVVTIDLKSSQFDAYVYLTDAAYEVLNEDDDSGGATNSQLVMTLQPGTYYVFATTWDDESGSFSLSTATRQPRTCQVQELGLNTRLEGALDGNDCTLDDFEPGLPQIPLDQFRITVTQRGTLEIVVTGAGFAPLIVLGDAEGAALIAGDENPGVLPTARLRATLAPGAYLFLLTTQNGPGTYSVQTTFTAQ
jgi:hypothetical protein